ncbi:hypothetical protein HMPREF1584_01261, partial [Gardnerella vaginalis JCP8481A]
MMNSKFASLLALGAGTLLAFGISANAADAQTKQAADSDAQGMYYYPGAIGGDKEDVTSEPAPAPTPDSEDEDSGMYHYAGSIGGSDEDVYSDEAPAPTPAPEPEPEPEPTPVVPTPA